MTEPGATPTGAEMVGRVIAGRYRIVSHLGEGAMGSVYLAEHTRIGRRDAIKVLRSDIARDTESVARFMRGARNVSAIRHPNVCTIYDFSDTEDGLQFMAMEYVAGETLKDTLDREGRLDTARALRIATQVAAALQAAHDVGIVHRDLKPGNVMITALPDGTDDIKVVDFDIAKGPEEAQGEEVTRLGFVVGTPEYMSPEQLMGERLDGRSDVYSLGVMLFRMLTAALPFRATSTQEIMVQRLTVAPLRLADVLPDVPFPPQLEQVLQRAQALNRNERYADAASFARDVEALLAGAAPAHAAMPPAVALLEEVPATRVVSASSPATPVQGRPGPTPAAPTPTAAQQPSGGAKRGMLVAAAVVVLALIGVGATVFGPWRGGGADAVTQQPSGEPPVATPTTPQDGGSDGNGGSSEPVAGAPPAAPGPAPAPERQDVEPPRPQPSASVLIERYDRELQALTLRALNEGTPPVADLRVLREATLVAWSRAVTRADSASAANILAEAALLANDLRDCRRWAERGSQLQPSRSFNTLLESCGE